MRLFEKRCACGALILGPRSGGKMGGEWLGHDECRVCRKRPSIEIARKQDGPSS